MTEIYEGLQPCNPKARKFPISWKEAYFRLNFNSEIIKIEHPMGSIDCIIVLNSNFKNNLVSQKDLINSCGIYRTSKILMKGKVYF